MADLRRWLAFAALAAGSLPAGAEELGTLFTTAEERVRLERLRRGEAAAPGMAEAPRPSDLSGYVKRSDGRGTLWIDGAPVPVDSARAAPLMDPAALRPREPDPALRIEKSGKAR